MAGAGAPFSDTTLLTQCSRQGCADHDEEEEVTMDERPNRLVFAVTGVLGQFEVLGPTNKHDRRLFQQGQREATARVSAFPCVEDEQAHEGAVDETTGLLAPTGAEEEVLQLRTLSFKKNVFSHRAVELTQYLAYLCFFICGVGYQIQFSSITSAVVYFKALYGSSILRIFIGAFNAPLLPILVGQIYFDHKIDQRFGSLNTFRIRLLITLVICTAILFAIPWAATPLGLVVSLVAVMGLFNGIANGAYFALVSVFPTKTPIFWSLGQRTCTVLILGTQLFIVDPSSTDQKDNDIFFIICASVSAVGILSFLILIHLTATRFLLTARDRRTLLCKQRQALQHKSAKMIQQSANVQRVNSDGAKDAESQSPFSSLKLSEKVTTVSLLRSVWLTVLSGMLILFSDVGVITALTYMPSSMGKKDIALILLYINYFGDFIGRQATLIPKRIVWNQISLLVASCIRVLFVPWSVFYIMTDYFVNDWFLFVMMALYAIMGGYIRTLVFIIGPQVVSLDRRPQVSLWLNVGVAAGTYLGIAYSFLGGLFL
ncbi:hypothetical protein QOT17_015208 [Balamuthia mandrillaris]